MTADDLARAQKRANARAGVRAYQRTQAQPLDDLVSRAREKALARRAEGKPAALPFGLESALVTDVLPPGALASAPVPASASESAPGQAPGRGRQRGAVEVGAIARRMGVSGRSGRVPAAVKPGHAAKYQGSAAMDRMLEHEDRERDAEE